MDKDVDISSIFKFLIISFLFIFCNVTFVEAVHDQNYRCKCVCPEQTNGTSRKVFIKYMEEPASCKCENVVNLKNVNLDFCDLCECEWQKRNTTTIKVVVIFILCLVSLLIIYMLFLLCLDPLMNRRPKTYMEQENEEVNLDTQSITRRIIDDSDSEPVVRNRPGAIMSRVKQEVNRVKDEQQRWKGTVQEQRKTIYDRHALLN